MIAPNSSLAAMDATIKIWSWRTGECIRTLNGHRDAVICLSYDANLLASGSADSTIKVWNFSTGETTTFVLIQFVLHIAISRLSIMSLLDSAAHREWVNSVVLWSPDDCTSDPSTSSTDLLPSSQVFSSARASSSDIFTAATPASTLPRIKLLFSASDDGTVRVWDLNTSQCVRILEGHVAQVQRLCVVTRDDTDAPPQFPAHVVDSKDRNNHDAMIQLLRALTIAVKSWKAMPMMAFLTVSWPLLPTHVHLCQHATHRSAHLLRPPFSLLLGRSPPERSSLLPLDFGTGPQPLLVSYAHSCRSALI